MSIQPLQSERVIVSSPMSVAGAWQRAMRLSHAGPRPANQWASRTVGGCVWCSALLVALAWVAIAILWTLVMVVLFSWLFIGWRVFRRGNRNRKAEQLRHRETLAALDRRRDP